jgi:hypothetical protein
MKTQIATRTNGRGYWSSHQASVAISKVNLIQSPMDDLDDLDDAEKLAEYGELRAYYDGSEWNHDEHGLIYTDKGWMESFKLGLKQLGMSDEALSELGYSEQGMQGAQPGDGNDEEGDTGTNMYYVSMDVGPTFITEWLKFEPRFVTF